MLSSRSFLLLSALIQLLVIAAPVVLGDLVPAEDINVSLLPVAERYYLDTPQLFEIRLENRSEVSVGYYRASCYLIGDVRYGESPNGEMRGGRGWAAPMGVRGMEGGWFQLPAGQEASVLIDVREFLSLAKEGSYRLHGKVYIGPYDTATGHGIVEGAAHVKLDVGATLVVEKATPEGRGKVMGELASRYAKADRVARLGILRILANWPVPESTRFLGGILENDWDWREAAAGCLGTQATKEATDLLATYVFGSGRNPSERVLRPLARSRAGRQQLWRNLDVTSPAVRCWILDALVGYDIPEDGLSRQAVERLLKDPAPEVRKAAEKAQERLRK